MDNLTLKNNEMYDADKKRGRPSIAPSKLLRAMLPQIFNSIRSERLWG
jgi:transposase